jgi:O-methyltransferase involved in polyketide biosynthesis
MSSTGRVSPTAHYTGYVWARNGLSDPELETVEGRVLFETLRVPMTVSALLGGATLEAYLLTRHRAIDALLQRAIDEGRVTQVVEVAAGLSPRGLRFTRRYGDRLTYVEADLPEMVTRKRAALERIGSLSDRHRVEEVDALRDQGPASLDELAARLDSEAGLAIITEGLLGYLEKDDVRRTWRRFAQTLGRFQHGTYISDIHMGELQNVQVRAFRVLLSLFVRGRVHLHFGTEDEILGALKEAGFSSPAVRRAASVLQDDGDRAAPATGDRAAPPTGDPGGHLAHIIEASTA